MRASRLLELLLLLQLRGRTPAAVLAAVLEVSTRTVYRDVEALAAAGVPVYAEPGRHGGICLQEGYQVGGLAGIDEVEARTMALAAAPGWRPISASTWAGWRPGRRARLLIEPEDWFKERDRVPWLLDVARGVWERRELRIDYRSKARPSTQVVRPLGLVLKGHAWYVVARTRRGADRTFRVSRIEEVAVLTHAFDRPHDFDLAEAWARTTREFVATLPRYMVTVRVASASQQFLGLLQEGTPALPLADDVERDGDGWVRLRLRFERPDSAARLLLQLGPGAEVLDPPELRALMAGAAQQLHALYA
ncbi:MAG: transcriptional regulator [Acidimicrobiales bacterium]